MLRELCEGFCRDCRVVICGVEGVEPEQDLVVCVQCIGRCLRIESASNDKSMTWYLRSNEA